MPWSEDSLRVSVLKGFGVGLLGRKQGCKGPLEWQWGEKVPAESKGKPALVLISVGPKIPTENPAPLYGK